MRPAAQLTFAIAVLLAGGLFCAQAADVSPAKADAKTTTAKVTTAKTATPAKPTTPAKPVPAKKDAKPRLPLAVTPEREAAVATFVERNHPELLDLLLYLKSSQTDEYERAVREIFRTTERLALIRERDRQQYELEVAAWQAQSRVQLLAAKLQMDTSDELKTKLREALRLQNDARLALLKLERQKTADRLAKLDADIARIENDREAIIDRQLKLLTRFENEKRPSRPNTKTSAKPTRKKP